MCPGEGPVTEAWLAHDGDLARRGSPHADMIESQRIMWLRVLLRILSAGFLAAFIPWITLILLNAPILAAGGRLAPLLRFQPYNAPYESMMTAIYVVWAIMLWRASANPAKHVLFIDFTIWATAAHALVMLIATPAQKGLIMTGIEGVPLVVIAAVLWWLRPNPRISQATR
jgi:hypothetical protein